MVNLLVACYALMALSLLADFYTTRAGIKRGAKESGPVKSAIGQGIVGAVILGAMYYACWGDPVKPAVAITVCLGIAATRFYAAWHNSKVAR